MNRLPPRRGAHARPRKTLHPLMGAMVNAILLTAAASALAAPNVTMGVYFDAAGTICQGTIAPGVPTTIYIVAHTPIDGERIAGAEFRFVGLPPSWDVYPVPNPDLVTIGDPFANGVTLAASGDQCQPAWSHFLMYTVLVIASEEVDDVRFELRQRMPPLNSAFACPLVVDCAGLYAMHCVQPTPCFVNARRPSTLPCAQVSAVVATTWTEVRNLFR